MVEGLPPGGALSRAASKSPWGSTEYLLAELADRLGRMETDFRNANRDEKTAAQAYPDPVWRPGDPAPKQREAATRKAEAAARQDYQRIVAIATPQHAEKG